jgi:arylesterase/paraoxonase
MNRPVSSTWPARTPRVARAGSRRWLCPCGCLELLLTYFSMGHLDAAGRGLTDRVAILDTRAEGPLASRLKWVTAENFSGVKGDGTLNLHGLDILADPNSDVLRILLVNHRPPFHPLTGEALDAVKVGANSTIEQFQTTVGSDAMTHVRTFADDVIQTPNDVAWVNDHSFVFTNDHSAKTGYVSIAFLCDAPKKLTKVQRRMLDPALGGGCIGYCDQSGCTIVKDTGLCFPNGIVRGRDGLFYTPSSITGEVKVLSFTEHRGLHEVASLKLPLPVDNLSVDKNGDIFAAGFPHLYKTLEGFKTPLTTNPPSAVLKISKAGPGSTQQGEYAVEKVMEDDGSVLPGASSAVHDAETGRFFLGGPVSPYITICETR